MAKLFSIILIILGIASFVRGITLVPSELLFGTVNLLAAVILAYTGLNMFKSRGQTDDK